MARPWFVLDPGRITIRDADGVSHELLHTHRQYVSIGDRVVAGRMVGTMGNMGVNEKYREGGDHHLHYQLIDAAGQRLDPQAYWNRRELPAPSPPRMFRSISDITRTRVAFRRSALKMCEL